MSECPKVSELTFSDGQSMSECPRDLRSRTFGHDPTLVLGVV
jgi:hypothetical protein